MKCVLPIVLAAALGSVAAAPWKMAHAPPPPHRAGVADIAYNQTTYWFDGALLDHFNMTDRRTWSQRFFVIDDFWAPPHGPVILHICGEYTCPGIMPARLSPLLMAQKHKALVISVEHRFFGESLPFPASTTANLAFHNSRQAVADLAWFTQWYQSNHINAAYSLPEDTHNKWTVVGGSYPGALAAWYRLKFPALSVGSHSSSGVVKAILEFTDFDKQVGITAGDTCAAALRNVTAQLEAGWPGVAHLFGAEELTIAGDFFYFMADSAAEAMQYAHRDVLCNALNPVVKAGGNPFQAFVTYVNGYFIKTLGNSPSDYNSALLADPVKGGNGRSWWWQKCTELAYWQVAPPTGAIRSSWVNTTYHRDLCRRVFGVTQLPAVNETNNYYGGTDVAVDNVLFYNGAADPWQWAGVRASLGPTRPAHLVDCGVDGTCAHCQDLYTPAANDPPELTAERQAVAEAYEAWLGE